MGLWNTYFGGEMFEGGELPDFTVELDPVQTGPTVFDAAGANNYGRYVYRFEDNGSNEHVFRWTRPETYDDLTDTDQLLLFYCNEVVTFGRVGALFTRFSGTQFAENGYSVNVDADQIFLEESSAGIQSVIASPTLPITVTISTWYFIQYRNIGDRHQARIWEYGTNPPNWQIDTTDSTHTAAGWTGPGCRSSNLQWFDYYSLGTEGDAAQLPYELTTPALQNTITAYPATVGTDATSFLVYTGEPNVAVDWNLTGDGSLSVITDYTNEIGQAFAKYTPGTVGSKTIDVTVGV